MTRYLELQSGSFSIDLLEAQEEVYLATLGKRVRHDLQECNVPAQDPEQFDLYRLLANHSNSTAGRSFSRLRSKGREYNRPYLDPTTS
jgi:hypothetical protein